MGIMKCEHCDAVLQAGVNKCHKCGKRTYFYLKNPKFALGLGLLVVITFPFAVFHSVKSKFKK